MKKAKIMLLTIVVLATVGTVLAFKVAKKAFTDIVLKELLNNQLIVLKR